MAELSVTMGKPATERKVLWGAGLGHRSSGFIFIPSVSAYDSWQVFTLLMPEFYPLYNGDRNGPCASSGS